MHNLIQRNQNTDSITLIEVSTMCQTIYFHAMVGGKQLFYVFVVCFQGKYITRTQHVLLSWCRKCSRFDGKKRGYREAFSLLPPKRVVVFFTNRLITTALQESNVVSDVSGIYDLYDRITESALYELHVTKADLSCRDLAKLVEMDTILSMRFHGRVANLHGLLQGRTVYYHADVYGLPVMPVEVSDPPPGAAAKQLRA